jgi:ech hydrogenase subunit D
MFFEAKEVTPQTLLDEVQAMADAKYRFVTLSQTVMDEDTLRLYYHFDTNLTMSDLRASAGREDPARGMVHLKMDVNKNEAIPSISSIYFCAVLVENETQDQFGVRFEGMPLDYQGGMYLEGEVTHAPYFTMTAVKRPAAAKKPAEGEQA